MAFPCNGNQAYQTVVWSSWLFISSWNDSILSKQKNITPFLKTSRVTSFFKVLITNAAPYAYFNCYLRKAPSLFTICQRIIAIEAQLYLLGLVGPELWKYKSKTADGRQLHWLVEFRVQCCFQFLTRTLDIRLLINAFLRKTRQPDNYHNRIRINVCVDKKW